MDVSLINKVKYNKKIYHLYSRLGSSILSIAKWLVPKDDKLIVFVSFGGRRFDDSPRAIYEKMLEDKRFSDYRLVWAFIRPEDYEIRSDQKIRIDTIRYYYTLLRARVWVTNSSVERGLHFKARRCIYFNSWHGSAIKVMGTDISSDNASFGDKVKRKNNDSPYDVFLAQGQYDVNLFSQAFKIPNERMKILGLPRNDVLVKGNDEVLRKNLRRKLNLSNDKKIILYAPTFREYDRDSSNNCRLTLPISLDRWEKELGNDYVLLVRAHYEVSKELNLGNHGFAIDVSEYPVLNELMIVSDMLISDYSSVFFDYSIQGKPMLTFCYDYDRYSAERGMYFDIRKELDDYSANEGDVIDSIKNIDFEKRVMLAKKFRNKYVEEYGCATERSVDVIWNLISM